MIRFENVVKVFKDGQIALDDINLHIKKGEFVFVIGGSGAGKSTIIKTIMKETEITSGNIFIDGRDITHLKRREIPKLRRSMGVVFQDFRLLPDRTVYENVAFAMEVTSAPAKVIRRQVPMVLSIVGLSQKSDLYPPQLSGGEQQRVSLARALSNSPNILIADEPTGNLDPATSKDIMNLLVQINQRGTTIVMATHARDIVDDMKKRVIEIEHGKIIRDEERGEYGA